MLRYLVCSIIVILLNAPLHAQAKDISGKIKVVASFSIIADMVKEVAGDFVIINTLVAPGGDVHVYSPSPADARNMAAADLIFINGLGFEDWMDRLLQSTDAKGRVVTVSKGIVTLRMNEKEMDPHAWQDISNAMIYVTNIRDALVMADPSHAVLYQHNARQYLIRLIELERWVRERIEEVPKDNRRAITSHDALHYFVRAYGINLIPAQGISTEGTMSAKSMAAIIDQMRQEHIKVVFLENMSNSRLIKQLAKDGEAVIGGTLYSDSLSDASEECPSYISMFQHNVKVLTDGLKK